MKTRDLILLAAAGVLVYYVMRPNPNAGRPVGAASFFGAPSWGGA